MKKIEINCQTNEEILIDMTPEELDQTKKRIKEVAQKEADQLAEAEAKAQAKAALLERLGISQAEANLLLS